MAKKPVAGVLKLQVSAGSASPAPPIGPALGQRGINIMEFCKSFNAATSEMEKGVPVPVIISYYRDKTFTYEMKTPLVSFLLKKAAGLSKGGSTPGRAIAGSVTKEQIREIAEIKLKDFNADSLEQGVKLVAGSARSMGLEIKG